MENIEQALTFLDETFATSAYFKEHLVAKEYRYQHTLRVANIAKSIAETEELDQEIVVIGALLHDISHAEEIKSEDDWRNHGRKSATLVKDFLAELSLSTYQQEQILLGIARHVDDEAGEFKRSPSLEALTISESDNIDRFDSYGLTQSYVTDKFFDKNISEQLLYLQEKIKKIEDLLTQEEEFSTHTAHSYWEENLLKRHQNYYDLLVQLERGKLFSPF